MSKKFNQFAAMGGIIFAMYNIIVFAIFGFADHAPAFWISYVFMLLTFCVVALSALKLGESGMALRDWLFGYPIVRHCAIYFVVELVFSLLFMVFEDEVRWAFPFVTQTLLLGVYSILLISCFISKTAIAEVHEKVEKKTRYIDLLQVEAQMLCAKCTDAALKIKCQKLAEAIRYSDPVSNEALSMLESQLNSTINSCSDAIDAGNIAVADGLCEQALLQLQERNLKCKALK